jgi:hypothetical protein
MITAEEIFAINRPFIYGTGGTSHDTPGSKPCAMAGCKKPRHLTAGGVLKSYCIECCRQSDRRWRERQKP